MFSECKNHAVITLAAHKSSSMSRVSSLPVSVLFFKMPGDIGRGRNETVNWNGGSYLSWCTVTGSGGDCHWSLLFQFHPVHTGTPRHDICTCYIICRHLPTSSLCTGRNRITQAPSHIILIHRQEIASHRHLPTSSLCTGRKSHHTLCLLA